MLRERNWYHYVDNSFLFGVIFFTCKILASLRQAPCSLAGVFFWKDCFMPSARLFLVLASKQVCCGSYFSLLPFHAGLSDRMERPLVILFCLLVASSSARAQGTRPASALRLLKSLCLDFCSCHSHPFPVPPCTRNPPIHPRKSYSTLRTHVFSTLLF